MNKIITILFLVAAGNLTVNAQIHCPYGGKVDCCGECGLFVDNDGDGFCDYGKLSKESKPTADTAIAPQTDKSGANSTESKSVAVLSYNEIETHENTSQHLDNEKNNLQETEPITQSEPAQALVKAPYHLFELSIALLLLYLVSALLYKYKVYSLATHRKIWNIGLTVSFLVCCIIGLLITYYVNVRSFPTCYRSLVFYHVEFGIAMTVIAIFHLIWHWRYYLNLFKSKKQKTDKQAKG